MAFIEFHVLQNFAPSNLNRDDTNSPKSCVFGGFKRSRISSQCQKRQIRLHPEFSEQVEKHGGDIGTRTKKLAIDIAEHLVELGKEQEQADLAAKNLLALVKLSIVTDKNKPNKTQYLLYLGLKEVSELQRLAEENYPDLLEEEAKKNQSKNKELAKQVKLVLTKKSYAADVALFGRMVADSTEMNVDAACQVAHAISTSEVKSDMDFFTAVEDGLSEGEQGSGMMGTLFFNSACYYRYAQINLDILKKNLGEDKKQALGAVIGFYKALLSAVPSGKQNSFAAQNPVCYVKAVVRSSGAPWSLANAFAKPVRVTGTDSEDLELESALKLEAHLKQLKAMYSTEGFELEQVSSYLAADKLEQQPISVIELENQLTDKLMGMLE